MTDTTPHFVIREFPSRIAGLGFSLKLPESWQPQDLPEEEPNFEDGAKLFGLGAAAAPYAAIIFAAAARPAFADGTVLDWSRWLIERNGIVLRALGPSHLGELPAIVGQCAAASDMGPMVTHFAFAEDGARLVHLSVTGPEALSAHVWQIWREILESFSLSEPKGATVALSPPADVQRPAEGTNLMAADVGSFALEGGVATLKQDHPINQSLLDQGRGFAPNIRAVDEAGGKAWVASIALNAVLELPFGWHPLDDGRRLVLLHPDSSVQVSLERMQAPDGSLEALLDRIEAQVRIDYPAPMCARMQSGPVLGLGLSNIHDGDQPLAQIHLVMAAEPEGMALRARATATAERAALAADLAEALLMGIRFAGEDAPAVAHGAEDDEVAQPEWAVRAYALEADNRLDEAEQVMRDGCRVLGVLLSIAEMYRKRMQRLAAAGDSAGAAAARERAVHFAHQYAGGATSGGEGVALSRQRDRFFAELGPK